jgi:hypothetical protein
MLWALGLRGYRSLREVSRRAVHCLCDGALQTPTNRLPDILLASCIFSSAVPPRALLVFFHASNLSLSNAKKRRLCSGTGIREVKLRTTTLTLHISSLDMET